MTGSSGRAMTGQISRLALCSQAVAHTSSKELASDRSSSPWPADSSTRSPGKKLYSRKPSGHTIAVPGIQHAVDVDEQERPRICVIESHPISLPSSHPPDW